MIPPKTNYTLHNVVVFEPPTLQKDPFVMNLYVKSDKLFMQKIKIYGKAVSGLLELTDIWKV